MAEMPERSQNNRTHDHSGIIRKTAAGFVLWAVLFVFSAFPAAALDWDHPGFEMGHISTVYNIRNGMPYSEINAAAQTEDGFMYFGSYGGLVRYDGRSFYRFDELSSVLCLYPDPDGTLWIGTNDMGFARMTPQAEFTYYGKEEGLKTLSVRSIVPDGKGNLFFSTTSGLYYMKNYKEEGDSLILLDDSRLKDEYITLSGKAGRNGEIYGMTEEGVLFSVRDFRVEKYWFPSETGSKVTCICPDPGEGGNVYLGTEEDYILYGKFDGPKEDFRRIGIPGLSGVNALELIDGKLWICTNSGIGCLDDEDGYQMLSLTPLTAAGGVLKDYEGNLWFYSFKNGVLKVSQSVFTDVSLMTSMKDRVVNTTWMKDDLLYAGTDTGLLVFSGDGNEVETPVSELLRSSRVRAIKEDTKGNLWFCTYSENGLVCLKPDGTYKKYNQKNGLISDYARTVFECSDGTIIVSVNGGIQFIKDGRICRTVGAREGIPNNIILTMSEDDDGRLYLGTNGNGIYILDGEELYPFRGVYDLDSPIILRIKRDVKRNCWWIVTSKEVGILQNGNIRRIENLPVSNLSSGCYDILMADNGSIWMLGGTGIYVADGDELLEGTAVDYRFYNIKNGLPHITTANSRSYVSPEGRAYIACLDGITGIDLNNMDRVSRKMKLAVPYIEADGKRIYTVPGEEIVLPSKTKRVVIYSYALSYALTDPVVACYLEGFDEVASIVTKETLYPRTYTNLHGGRYVFHLNLVDPSGRGDNRAEVVIVKEKAFYEQVWFWGLMGFAVLAFITMFVRHLLWLQQRKLEKKREAERISSELSMAADIQTSALPNVFPAFPDRTDFDIYASMTPAREVGGDFYDFFLVDQDHLAMVMADVSDKGVPAALYMMSAKISISDFAMMGKMPAEVLTAVNNVLTGNSSEMFVTVWLGVLDLRTGELTAANAGHEYPFMMQPGRGFELVKDPHGIVLGAMEGFPYEQYTLRLEPGAKLFLYTDGIPEASDKDGKFFGLDRTLEALNSAEEGTPEEILNAVHGAVKVFAGDAPQFDDMTMMCLHFKGSKQ